MTDPDETTRELPRILIVEDEWLIALDLQESLEEAGYVVVGPAPTVSKALDLIKCQSVEAGLLDLHVGGENSYPVATVLKTRGIPFAFLTGHSRNDLKPEFRQELVLAKPILLKDLHANLVRMLRTAVP